jgi:hypothetical protein
VFDCPTWEHNVVAEINFETERENTTRTALLHPGMTYRIGNFSITPLAISQAPAPVMNERFVSNGTDVALLGDMPTDLYCPTREEAVARNCSLSPESCVHCEPDSDVAEVNCQCRDTNWETAFEDPQRRLPLSLAKLHLRNRGREVFTETSHAPVQLLLKMEDLRLVSEASLTKCRVTPLELSGCYDCATGGQLRFRCRTDTGSALASATCEDGKVFAHRCNETDEEHAITLSFNQSTVDTVCHVACPGGDTDFKMKGRLLYIPLQRRGSFTSRIANATATSWWPSWFPNFDLKFDIVGSLAAWLDLKMMAAVALIT